VRLAGFSAYGGRFPARPMQPTCLLNDFPEHPRLGFKAAGVRMVNEVGQMQERDTGLTAETPQALVIDVMYRPDSSATG